MDKQAKLKFFGSSILLIILFAFLVSGIQTYLDTADNFVDDDGYLDLRGRCEPTSVNSHDGTTTYNITNATVWSNVGGTWKANYTINNINSGPNSTYYFNFTGHINQSAEGSYQWNIECFEQNMTTDSTTTNSGFTANRTIEVTYANPTIEITSPADGSYDFDGHAIPVNCEGSPTSTWNITQIELMTTIDGSWSTNQTYTVTPTEAGISTTFTINKFGNSSIADGTGLVYGCRATQQANRSNSGNEPFVTSVHSSANRTVNIEYPPNIQLNKPDNSAWSSSADDLFNFTPISAFTSGIVYYCQQWANDSGTWAVVKGSFSARNNTPYTFNHQLQEKSDISWGIYCQEGGDANVFNFSVNRTISIDRTAPTIAVSSSNLTTNDNTPSVTFTPTDANLDTIRVFTNISGTWNANFTNNTADDGIVSGVEMTAQLNGSATVPDGVYIWSVVINDSAGIDTSSANYSLIIDTAIPKITAVGNASVSGSSDERFFNFSANENVNFTIFYGTTVNTLSHQDNSTFHTIQNVTISGFEENTQYYWNITACDRAGNCNNSGGGYGQFDITYPWKLLTGWSYYGIFDARINFSYILDQTEAEYVYYWNQTNQEWISATAGGSTEMDFVVGTAAGDNGGRHVVILYEETNSTWDKGTLGGIVRNTTNSGYYFYNITVGDNYIKLPTDYTFGNLSISLLNSSYNYSADAVQVISGYGFGIELSQTPEGLVYNLTQFWFSAYNNTGTTWEPYYIYNQTAENNTVLSVPGPHEVVWIHSDEDNLTWNGTNIIGNWTI